MLLLIKKPVGSYNIEVRNVITVQVLRIDERKY